MRPERLYLLDMIEAADHVVIHIAGRDRNAFMGDVTARAAVLHELTVIGEGAARLSEPFRARHPSVPWTKIVALRNFVVHEYFGLGHRLADGYGLGPGVAATGCDGP